MKHKDASNTEAAAIALTITGCITQLAPVMDKYPVGSIISAFIVGIISICWKRNRSE
jgi:uncharacterized membrane protein YjjB (DUF3815 family)